MKKDIGSFTLEELNTELLDMGEKPFRAKQIYEWLHKKLVTSFAEMTNLSIGLRERLEESFIIDKLLLEDELISKKDETRKYLFRLSDENVIESVWMKYEYGNSVCISSQVGCRMGCRFCASTIGGLKRNLTSYEMLSEIYNIQKLTGERVSNIVIMGTGEPLDNYDNVVKFIRMITDKNGLNVSGRNITLSTCGIAPGIRKLAEEGLQITLALSLHGGTQEKRRKLLPIANKYHLEEVLSACEYYFEKTGRRVSVEYSLIEGENDRQEDIKEVADILKKLKGHLNLIPVNPIKEREFSKPNKKNIEYFKNSLEKLGINVTIRRERGADINGACGQLRLNHINEKEKQ